MADGCPEEQLRSEALLGETNAIDEETASDAVPLVAGTAAAEISARSPKRMRVPALALAAALSAAALLALAAPGSLGAAFRAALHSADPSPGALADGLTQEFVVNCLPEEHGVDYLGGAGKSVSDVPNIEACRAKCLAVPSCTMWTWVAGTGIPLLPTQCWVKGGAQRQQVRVLPGGKHLANYASGCIQERVAKALPTSPYTLNYQADHAAGEPPGMGCGPPGPLPAIWTAPVSAPPTQVSVLTYNLAWWNVFDHGRPGEFYFHELTHGNAAMGLIKSTAASKALDVMAFQECNNIDWLLQQTGLAGAYTGFQGLEAVCLAFKFTVWSLIAEGQAVVGEDTKNEYWGRRMGQWMRLQHKGDGKSLFVMNHHGPLPVSSGGVCGAPATARRLLDMIAANAHPGEPVILVGDFNAEQASATINMLKSHLHSVAAGTMHNGIDNIFSNLPPSAVVAKGLLGTGGSDHNALFAQLHI